MLRNVRLLVWEAAHNADLQKLRAAPGSAGADRADLSKFPWPFPDWPLERVLRVYHYVAGQLRDSDGRIFDKWDELTAHLARIIVEERTQADFVDHYNYMQAMRNQPRSGLTTITRRA